MKGILITALIFLMNMDVSAQGWLGSWEGVLVAGPQKLKIVFNIKKGENGLQATMDSPDQLVYDMKIDEVVVKDNEITLTLNVAHAQYIGTFNEDQSAINGDWIQGVPLELNLTRAQEEIYKRPQEPKGPFPYKIEQVTYENKSADGIKLAGTLTIPEGNGKHPVVVLISGSGPQDRDESILKHKPFWVIADFLTRNGVAVLRFDDRGVGESEGTHKGATSADFATDVSAGVAFLKSHASIDSKKIGLMGHSEGGLIAPIVASKDKSIAFIVLLAGPGVPGKDLLLQQNYDIMKLKNLDEKLLQTFWKINSKLYDTVIRDKKGENNVDDFMESIKEEYASVSDEDKTMLGLDEASLRQGLVALQSKWMQFFISSVPSDYLTKVKCPVLALNGEKDLQVAGKMNLDAIDAALAKSKNKNYKCVLLPDLNHLFQTCETGSVDEYLIIEETFSADVMQIILEWINAL
jgi:uncharacterized protein